MTADLTMDEEITSNVVPALIATLISGLSTGIGGLMILFYGKPSNTKIGHMLSFSSGVMIYISFMDLLYESIIRLGFYTANLWFFVGMVFFALVLKLFPEPKIIDKKAKARSDNGKPSQEDLIRLGIVTAIGISLHNFPEGLAVYVACLKGIHMGLPLTVAIAMHNIPEGLAVAAPIYEATGSKWQALKYSVLSGVCEPFGALVFGIFFSNVLTPYIVQCLLAGVAGIMVFMVIRELMPATLKYIKASDASISNLIGMFVMFYSVYYLHGMLPHEHTPLYDTGASAASATGSHAAHTHDATCAHDH
jgi:ZIP family zinc transporter